MTIFGALLHMGYHALTKPVLFFAAGNIHQTCHTLQLRLIGPGMAKVLPLTALCLGLAGAAAAGLPPFGLFFSELTVLSGGFAAGHIAASCDSAGGDARLVLRHSLSAHPHSAGHSQGGANQRRRAVGRRAGHGPHAGRAGGVQRLAARAAAGRDAAGRAALSEAPHEHRSPNSSRPWRT